MSFTFNIFITHIIVGLYNFTIEQKKLLAILTNHFIKSSTLFLFIILLIKPYLSFSQIYPLAREVWSTPVKVDSFAKKFTWESESTLTPNSDTIYLFINNSIYMSYLKDGVWQSPKKLNSNVNDGSPIRNPSISKDSKRLYYSSWGGYGGWDLWYSNWDARTKDWGPSINLGPTVNSYRGEYYAYELSKDTLYAVNDVWAGQGVCIYIRDSITGNWRIVDSSKYSHPFGQGFIRGLSITANRKKAYLSQYVYPPSLKDSLQSELLVTYWDSVKNRWGNTYNLNINSPAIKIQVDSTWSYWIGGWDEYPWISPNGRVLFFTSNRDAAREDSTTSPDIYISYLLIDEKGDTVTTVEDIREKVYGNKLYPNYPNPFSGSGSSISEVNTTTITFELVKESNVSLIIYNVLGEEITRLIENKIYPKGKHNIVLNFAYLLKSKISSGIYFSVIKIDDSYLFNKMVYLK